MLLWALSQWPHTPSSSWGPAEVLLKTRPRRDRTILFLTTQPPPLESCYKLSWPHWVQERVAVWWMLWGDTEEQEEPHPRGLVSGGGGEGPSSMAWPHGVVPQLGAGVPKEAPTPLPGNSGSPPGGDGLALPGGGGTASAKLAAPGGCPGQGSGRQELPYTLWPPVPQSVPGPAL